VEDKKKCDEILNIDMNRSRRSGRNNENMTVIEVFEYLRTAINMNDSLALEFRGHMKARIFVNKKTVQMMVYDPVKDIDDCVMIKMHPYKKRNRTWYIDNIASCNREKYGKCAMMFVVFFLIYVKAGGIVLQDDARDHEMLALRVKNMVKRMNRDDVDLEEPFYMDDHSYYRKFNLRDYDVDRQEYVTNTRTLSEFEEYDYEEDRDKTDDYINPEFNAKQLNMRSINRNVPEIMMYSELPVLDDEGESEFRQFLSGLGTFEEYFLRCPDEVENTYYPNYKKFMPSPFKRPSPRKNSLKRSRELEDEESIPFPSPKRTKRSPPRHDVPLLMSPFF
jgi:hypothetical protein